MLQKIYIFFCSLVRSRWMRSSSYSPSLTEHPLKIYPIRSQNGQRPLTELWKWWLAPSILLWMDTHTFHFGLVLHININAKHILVARVPHDILMKSQSVLGALLDSWRFDLFMHSDVTQREVRQFQETQGLLVLRSGGEVGGGLEDVASFLNCLAERLWHQDCMAASLDGCPTTHYREGALI